MSKDRRDVENDSADVFVSYAHADNSDGWIDALVSQLNAYAKAVRLTPLRIFLDRTAIRTMEDWELRILAALRSSTVLLTVISPKYIESSWCRREWETFRLHELDRGTRAIAGVYSESVPDLASDTPPYASDWIGDINSRQYVDLRQWRSEGPTALMTVEASTRIERLAQDILDALEKVRCVANALSNVPGHDRRFCDRRAELSRLEQLLLGGRPGTVTPLVHGLPGFGKSALTFEYAHWHKHAYPGGRFFVDVSNAAEPLSVMLRIAQVLEINLSSTQATEQEIVAGTIRLALEKRPQTLLILRDVVEPRAVRPQAITSWLPNRGNIHLLMTSSSDPALFRDVEVVEVPPLPGDDALRLLTSYRVPDNATEEAATRKIAQMLDGIPLLLEQAAIYIGVRLVSYKDLLLRLEKESGEAIELIGNDEEVHPGRRTAAPLGILLSGVVARLTKLHKLTLAFCVTYSPGAIPLPWIRDLLARTESMDAPKGHPDPWRGVLQQLRGLRLLADTEDPELVRMHSTIRNSLRTVIELVLPLELVKPIVLEHARHQAEALRFELPTTPGQSVRPPPSFWQYMALRDLAHDLLDCGDPSEACALALLTAQMNFALLTENEKLQVRAVEVAQRMPPGTLRDAGLSFAFSELSKTLMHRHKFEEAREALRKSESIARHALLGEVRPLEVREHLKGFLEHLQIQYVLVDESQRSHAFAMSKMREEYDQLLATREADNLETRSFADWLATHEAQRNTGETETHPVVLGSRSDKLGTDVGQRQSSLENIDDPVRRDVEARLAAIEAKGWALPFDRPTAVRHLETLALGMQRSQTDPLPSLDRVAIVKELSGLQNPQPLLNVFVDSGILEIRSDGRYQFTSVAIRDYFVLPTALHQLSSEFVDRGLMWDRAINTLSQMGGTAAPALVRSLQSVDAAVRDGAAFALCSMGALAVPGLLMALDNRDPAVRAAAASALTSREGALAALPQLMKALADPAPSVRMNAAYALAESAEHRVVPTLQKAMESDSHDRILMAGALQKALATSRDSRPDQPPKL